MEQVKLKASLEAVLFASGEPLKLERLQNIFALDRNTIKGVLQELMVDYAQEDRGVVLEEIAGGFQLRTKAEHAPWILKLKRAKRMQLSKAAMETLAIIAYRQPVTRIDIEDLRGVDSGGVVRLLLEKQLIKIVGKKDAPGRPSLYATSNYFLEYFSLNDLSCLPSLREFAACTSGVMTVEMDFES